MKYKRNRIRLRLFFCVIDETLLKRKLSALTIEAHLARPAPMPFVVGVGRSGTTLLRLMLDAHPDLAMTPEFNWLENVMDELGAEAPDISALATKITKAQSWRDMGMPKADLETLMQGGEPPFAGSFLRKLYAQYAARFGKPRYGDKTPKNVTRMLWMQDILPEARFIHIIRDGRDVALSWKSVWIGANSSFDVLAQQWVDQISQARQDARSLTHYLEIRYEELVESPDVVLKQVCNFIDLDMRAEQLQFYDRAPARLKELKDFQHRRAISAKERRAMFELTTQPVTASRVQKWKTEMSVEDLAAFEKIAGDLLDELNYERFSR